MRFQIECISLKGSIVSKHLRRKVKFRLEAPPHYKDAEHTFPVLLMNDGQDFLKMNLENTLTQAYASPTIVPFVYVGIECNENRIHEYGTASSADYKGRGGKALQYSKFILEEMIPFLKGEFKVSKSPLEWVYCGLSLGGLSAFDIVYNHPQYFSKVGVFSGSFWWRKKAFKKNDMEDRSRIVLDMVKQGQFSPHLKFWFQCGTKDETADRNNNGVIDAIDDTMDLINELTQKGYSYPGDIKYVQLEGGRHDVPTWGRVFPEFIKWAFGTNKIF